MTRMIKIKHVWKIRKFRYEICNTMARADMNQPEYELKSFFTQAYLHREICFSYDAGTTIIK